MARHHWDSIGRDCKLAAAMIGVVAEWMLPQSAKRDGVGKLFFGKSFPSGTTSIFDGLANQGDGFLEHIDVSNSSVFLAARYCYDFLAEKAPIDTVRPSTVEADGIYPLNFILEALPRDSYGFGSDDHSSIMHSERALPRLLADAQARVRLAEFVHEFDIEGDIGFAGFSIEDITCLSGLASGTVRNATSRKADKAEIATRTIPFGNRRSSGYVVCDPIDSLEWMVKKPEFATGGVSDGWAGDMLCRVKTQTGAARLPIIYCWLNHIDSAELAKRIELYSPGAGWTASKVGDWVRGRGVNVFEARHLAIGAGIDPDRYQDLVRRVFAT